MNTVLSGDNYGYNLKIFDKECWNIYYHIEGLELKRSMSTLVGFEIIEF